MISFSLLGTVYCIVSETIVLCLCVENRPYVFLTSRVHPGESNASWVMKGHCQIGFCLYFHK